MPEEKKDHPILFSGPMVKAILAGRKTQTRRVIKFRITGPNPPASYFDMYDGDKWIGAFTKNENELSSAAMNCPNGKPGDRLWVRESMHRDEAGPWHYSADCETVTVSPEHESAMRIWAHHKQQDYCPSIHMPRWASRITLEITKVRVERLQDISEADAIAEGCQGTECYRNPQFVGLVTDSGQLPEEEYHELWDKINATRDGGIYAWEKNPWVWVVEFKRVLADPPMTHEPQIEDGRG